MSNNNNDDKLFKVLDRLYKNKPKPQYDSQNNEIIKDLYVYQKPTDSTNSKLNKQLERDAMQWKKYLEKNRGKIPNRDFKTIFDRNNATTRKNLSEK